MSDEGELGRKAKLVRKFWFDRLGVDEKDKIIKPAFDKDHPTNEKIREANKQFERLYCGK